MIAHFVRFRIDSRIQVESKWNPSGIQVESKSNQTVMTVSNALLCKVTLDYRNAS